MWKYAFLVICLIYIVNGAPQGAPAADEKPEPVNILKYVARILAINTELRQIRIDLRAMENAAEPLV